MISSPISSQYTNTSQEDDDLDAPYLAGFEWDKEECWTRLIVHQTKNNTAQPPVQTNSKKNKKKNKEENL